MGELEKQISANAWLRKCIATRDAQIDELVAENIQLHQELAAMNREVAQMSINDIKKLAVERIYLFPGEHDGEITLLWGDDPAPGQGMDPSEAVEYVRKDVHDARIAELNRECDAYCAAEETQIALRQKADEREQALAAHVGRFNALMGEIQSEVSCGDDGDGDVIPEELWSLWRNKPETSLARRDLIKQAEALEEARSELYEFPASAGMAMVEHVGGKAEDLRQRAQALK